MHHDAHRDALNQTLGAHLRALRADAGLTQSALGRRCDMTAAEICRFERGQRTPHLQQLHRLAQGLAAPMWILFTSQPVFELIRAWRRLPPARRAEVHRHLLSGQDTPPAG